LLTNEELATRSDDKPRQWHNVLSLSWKSADLVYVVSRKVLLSYALLVGLAAAALMASEVSNDREAISIRHEELHRATEEATAEALWTFNETLLASIATGLERDAVITGASIRSADGNAVYHAGMLSGSQSGWGTLLSDRYVSEQPINWQSDRGVEVIGYLVMETSEDMIRQQLLQRALLIFLFATIALLSLFAVFLVVVRQHVVRPISILTRTIEQFRLGQVQPATADKVERPTGEIGRLFESFEVMEDRLRAAHEKLTAAADEMARKLSEQAAELARTHQRNVSLQITRAQESERKRLVRDMHDGFGSELASARIAVERGTVNQEEIASFLSKCIADLHLIINVTGNEAGGLPEALADWRYRVSRQLSAEPFRLIWDVHFTDTPNITPRAALQILRIAQEALFNATRHSGASEIKIKVGHVEGTVVLEIQDNGKGLPPNHGSSSNKHGKGLASMRARAREIGASLEILSDGGCTVKLVYRPPAPTADGAQTVKIFQPDDELVIVR